MDYTNTVRTQQLEQFDDLAGAILQALDSIAVRVQRANDMRAHANAPILQVLERIVQGLAEIEPRAEALDVILSHRAGVDAAHPSPRTTIDQWVRDELDKVAREQRQLARLGV